MHEATSDYPAPRERIISLLQADFTPSDKTALADRAGAEDNALAGLLAQARGTEDFDARWSSEESAELGQAVERLTGPAPVTLAFKGFIANEVRQAHAWQRKVDDVVSPERLGIQSGEGIFDAAQAQEIEAQTLRAYSFRIIDQFIAATIEGEDSTTPPQLFLAGSVRPSDYREAVDILDEWTADYQRTYDNDPFDGVDRGVSLGAIGRIVVPKGSGTAELIKHLRQLRAEGEQE
jgi:hypothetical protein